MASDRFDREPGLPLPQQAVTREDVMRRAGRLLGRLKDGADTAAILKGTLELLLDMHR